MKKQTRYSPEVRERAVRLVHGHQKDYASQWGAIVSIAPKIGCTPETLRTWVRQSETDQGIRGSLSVIRHQGPWRNVNEVEFATLEWVDWFNNRRLFEPIGNIPPVEHEMAYYRQLEESDEVT